MAGRTESSLTSAEEEIAIVTAVAAAASRGRGEVATDDEVIPASYEEEGNFLDHEVPSIIRKMKAMGIEANGDLNQEEIVRRFEDVEQEAATEEAIEATESITSQSNSGRATPTSEAATGRTPSPAEERAAEGRKLAALFTAEADYKYEDFVSRRNPELFPTFKYMVN